ncbi:hypothetical protein FA15DRAFT_588119 [Coprinopsis marcescibilis]|uniref:Uncharacterized protein n=1 Tax=Coprinopsis marcescibilis TaxID=230819 RepID=A0A5C3L1F9_COPMA|nr:hypothetical protein FA15DRAFT_588119 [Coprinopsis marcescibilis]
MSGNHQIEWTTDNSNWNGGYVPTEEDVFTVQDILFRSVLPPELGYAVLDEAEYWPRLTCKRGGEFESGQYRDIAVRTSAQNAYKGSQCYMVSPSIPTLCTSASSTFKIRRIVFKTMSHDQGWCSETNFCQPYDGSWTWFEAAIFRGLGKIGEEENPEEIAEKVLRNDSNVTDKTEDAPFQVRYPQCDPNESGAWPLQKNLRASVVHTTHEVTWRYDDSLTGRAESSVGKLNGLTGSGRGEGFISKLQGGDRIAVIGKTRFPGWCNFIAKVEIEIYYSV